MRIYVSSSFVDLKEYRAAVLTAIRSLGHDYLAMEDYEAEDQLPVDKCLQDVAQCDLYVGIFAWRYGYIPEGHERSITELEYRKAFEQGIPTLIFLLDEDAPWSPRLMDKGVAAERIATLRDEFKTQKLISFFTSPDDLKAKAATAIVRQVEKLRIAHEEEKRLFGATEKLPDQAKPAPLSRPPIILPHQPSPLLGRVSEIERCTHLLRQPTIRLITLVGFGGLGKTRIALHLAHLCSDEFADGAYWIDLEEARDDEAMVQRIASELRLHLQPQPSLREQLCHFFREREMLLVLDNVEQIPNAANVVNEFLSHSHPRLTCLVTSRSALDLQAEHRVEVHPMPPEDAQALFLKQAKTRQTDFAITKENAADVIELCRRLEGVPLAIELAASRTAGMSPRDILKRFDEQFYLLQSRAPDLRPRQRALRAAIDWSYELLSDEDKSLFAQLSVFSGGFTIEAAEAVCGGLSAFEGVMELRRQSLLRTETNDFTQQTRLFMLVSVHAYAAEKLAERDEESMLRQRHAEYFLKVAEEGVARLRTKDEVLALAELSCEFSNLRAALQWAKANNQCELCARLAITLHHPLYQRGFWSEVRQCLQTGLESLSETPENSNPQNIKALQAAILLHLAEVDYDMGQTEVAERQANSALTTYIELSDEAGQARSLNLLGLLATDAEEFSVAQSLFQKALSLRSESDYVGRAVTLHNLARVTSRFGDKIEAKRLYEAALAHRRESGYPRGEAETLGDLGVLAQEAGDNAAAKKLYLESLEIRQKLGDRLGIALMLYNLADLAESEGEPGHAAILYLQAQKLFRELQSIYLSAPNEALQRIESQLGRDTFNALRDEAEAKVAEALRNGT